MPWLCPAADALLTLTDAAPLARTLSGDIAFCAHVARFLRPSLTPTCRPFDALTLTHLRAAPEQHAVRQDDCHHAFVLQVVEPVEQKRKVSRALWR